MFYNRRLLEIQHKWQLNELGGLRGFFSIFKNKRVLYALLVLILLGWFIASSGSSSSRRGGVGGGKKGK